ncbi:MAG: outer membrane protein assembly factor BamD [Gammaproteobacteria bacterium]
MRQFRLKALISILGLGLMAGCGNDKRDSYKGLSAQEIFELAQKHESKENFKSASRDYEALEARYPYGQYSDTAQLRLIYAYYKQGDVVQGLAMADRFIRLHPNHDQVDYAYYLKGMIYHDQHMSLIYRYLPVDRSIRDKDLAEKGVIAFAEFLSKFPNSKYREEAQEKYNLLHEHVAQYEINVASYYFERRAYVSAIQRANYVLAHYACYQSIKEQAKAIIRDSEEKLKL